MESTKSRIFHSNTSYRHRLTKSTPIKAASIFVPRHRDEPPESHFPLQTVYLRTPQPRFVNRYDSREILIVVDGSCLNNGHSDPQLHPPSGGCSFVYKGWSDSDPVTLPTLAAYHEELARQGKVAFSLEQKGPGGDVYQHTSNRAKLRAVIGALEFRPWSAEGWRKVVILTDLEYVAFGATRWLPRWVKRGWRNKHGKVANRDMWEELHCIIERLATAGVEVAFWLVRSGSVIKTTSDRMKEAKRAARTAAGEGAMATEFTMLCGIEM
jgi:ribonuclease HI